jgi:hypothetical protein
VRSTDETLRLRIRRNTARAFLKKSRDRQITPDRSLSDARLGTMAPRYRGRGADRGWDTQGRMAMRSGYRGRGD